MPSGSNVIGTILTMDTQSFVVGAHEARQLIRDLTKEFDASDAGMGRWQKSIQGVGKRMEFLEAKIKVEEALIRDYKAQIESLSADYAKNESRIRSLEEGILSAKVEINKYTKQLEDCQEQLDRMWMAAEEASTPLYKLTKRIEEQEKELADLILRYKNLKLSAGDNSDELFELENRISSLNEELRENRNILSQIDGSADALTNLQKVMPKGFTVAKGFLSNLASNAVYDAIHRIGDAIREVVDITIEWESAFTGVRRTVEGTEDDYMKLEAQLRGMGTTVATPLGGIADIAALAGQMGIPVDQISEFTRVMIMLGDTTNITAEEAGDSLARLANLLNLTTEDFERMGSTIVDLGNKFPTTESEIAAMASRLGGTANMLGITADEVLGIANAISAVGLEAEMGGNAVSKTLREMQLAVENGTANLRVFASTAGTTVDDFAELFQRDATGALQAFINGLGDVSRNGKSVTQILKNLNITELRQVDTLSRLATNTDTLNDSLAVAKEAWEENMALSVEANKRYQTIESQLQMMRNAWSNVAIDLMEKFTPAIRKAIRFTTSIARALTGQQGASEELDTAITNLKSATDEFRKAQDDAKDSTDALTEAMVQLRKEQQRQSFIEFAGLYQNSITQAENAKKAVTEAVADLRDTVDSDFFKGVAGDENKRYLLERGFDIDDTSASNILSMYKRLDEIEELSNNYSNKYLKIRTSRGQAFKKLYDLLTDAKKEITAYEDALKNLDITNERVWENQEIALRAYANLYDSGDIVSSDFIGKVDEDILSIFQNLEKGWDRGKKVGESYADTLFNEEQLQSYVDTLSSEMETVDKTSDAYWGLVAAMEAAFARADELGIKLKGSAEDSEEEIANLAGTAEKSAKTIWKDLIGGIGGNIRLGRTTGDEFGTEEIVDSLKDGLEEIQTHRAEIYAELTTAKKDPVTNSALIKALTEEAEKSEETEDRILTAYQRYRTQLLMENLQTDWEDLVTGYSDRLAQQDYINALLGLEPEENNNSAIRSQIEANTAQIWAWRAEIDDTEIEEYKLELRKKIKGLQDWNTELASQYQPDLGEDDKKGNWWSDFTDSLTKDWAVDFGKGFEAMIKDLGSLWETIGGGFLETFNQWIDAELDALDRMESELQKRLDKYTDMIEQNRKEQENILRIQLRNGEIDEEEYYRQSAQNKYEAEAQKQKAEEESQRQLEELQKQREELERKQFEADKANSIADVWISAAQGIAAAWSHGEPISAGIITGLITAMAGAQTGIIASQQYTPALATGGIVTAPMTALIGEAGKEAVLPLEQNTDWMDELAYRIGSIVTSDRIRTAIDRTLNEDGRTVDETKNMQFTQIINSPKALSRKEIYRDTRRLFRMVDRRTS